jgi:hypothetical protein
MPASPDEQYGGHNDQHQSKPTGGHQGRQAAPHHGNRGGAGRCRCAEGEGQRGGDDPVEGEQRPPRQRPDREARPRQPNDDQKREGQLRADRQRCRFGRPQHAKKSRSGQATDSRQQIADPAAQRCIPDDLLDGETGLVSHDVYPLSTKRSRNCRRARNNRDLTVPAGI